MRFIITGRNIDITEGLKSAVEEKLGKLDRFFAPETEVNVTLSVEKERQKIEVTIPVKGNIIRSEQVSSDMYVSIDLVEEVIERQLKKYKNKIVDKQQNAAAFAQEFVEKDYDDDETYKPHFFLKRFLTALKASQIAEPEFSKTLTNLSIVSIIS